MVIVGCNEVAEGLDFAKQPVTAETVLDTLEIIVLYRSRYAPELFEDQITTSIS